MIWTIDYAASVHRSVRKLDRQAQCCIRDFLEGRLAIESDPRRLGTPLTLARHRNLWRYRIGDYRIVAAINDPAARILIVRISHRRDVYTRLT
ncbi:MAG: type II toxin-antitoxin system RelE/ParE family toxin [Rhodobacteraceae bacterium]|nr:type II toxin-antitoxin system RelE/ParE family toxin [Paracoccaceae bacterium]